MRMNSNKSINIGSGKF